MAEAVAREAPGLPCCTHSQAGVNDHPILKSWMLMSRFIRAQVNNETRPENFGKFAPRVLALLLAEIQRWNGF